MGQLVDEIITLLALGDDRHREDHAVEGARCTTPVLPGVVSGDSREIFLRGLGASHRG